MTHADPGAAHTSVFRPEKLAHTERSIPLMTRENGRMASWNRENGRGFHFGIEAEYLLVDSESFRPLWHHDFEFEELNAALETIPFEDMPPLGRPGAGAAAYQAHAVCRRGLSPAVPGDEPARLAAQGDRDPHARLPVH